MVSPLRSLYTKPAIDVQYRGKEQKMPNDTMRIYHGGYAIVKTPRLIAGKYTKDFGPGFYCTTIREQAERWAKRYDTPVINVYDFDMDKRLNILDFEEMTEAWLDFIIACRGGIKHAYDIVSGAMANDQVYNYIADYINGILTREQFWVLAQFKYPTQQISFCTEQALACLTFITSEFVKP
jgi:hypothetical protein